MYLIGPSLPAILLAVLGLGSLFLFGMANVPNIQPIVVSASGAITPQHNVPIHITKATPAALTLALPTIDGIRFPIIDETGAAHTVVLGGSPPNGLNKADGTLTFNGTAGSSCELISRNGHWWAVNLNGVAVS